MTRHYDIAVLGLGIVGSAMLASLSSRHNVVGIERFEPPHAFGSSHGGNRIIRGAPAEGLVYAQMAAKAFEMFDGLSKRHGRPFLHMTGGFDSSIQGEWAGIARQTCDIYNLPYAEINGETLGALHGNYNLPGDTQVILQPRFGHVDAEGSWQAFLDDAHANGATALFGRKVANIDFGPRNTVHFDDGSKIAADKIMLAAGGWMNDLLDIPLKLTVERRVMAWYEIEEKFGDIMPFCLFDQANNMNCWYGMPSADGRYLKIGEHKHFREATDPDNVAPPGENDRALLNRFIRNFTRGIKHQPARMATCKYTLTHDGHFIIDRHPAHDNVFIFSCCSGHGFKYAPVYGDIALAFAEGRPYDLDLSLFKIDRHIDQTRDAKRRLGPDSMKTPSPL